MKHKRFFVVLLALLPLMAARLLAQEPYALLSEGNTVLTFFYDDQKTAKGGMSVGPFSSFEDTGWHEHRESIKTVVFDPSFAGCTTLTSTAYWFYDFTNLATITDIKNLHTDNVTNMSYMFVNCSSLTSLNLSSFNTGNVTNVNYMFSDCSSLNDIDVSKFNTANVTTTYGMFSKCSDLVTLDLSNFNTISVTNMSYMFEGCSELTIIYVGNGWTLANVSYGGKMFKDCTNLVGGNGTPYDANNTDHTYARIDEDGNPGYFTYKAPPVSEPYAVLSNDYKTLTFFYDDKKAANNGKDVGPFEYSGDRGWYSLQYEIKNVVFTPSFADCTSLTSTALWFCNCKNLTSISGLEYLKTDNVTDMNRMFMGCESLTVIDATHFNTENVTEMDYMFYECTNLASLDVSGFKTAKVESMECMFRGCSSLTSLNVSNFNTVNVKHLAYMFSNCASLTGLDVSGFNTANSFDTDHMFNGCSSLTSLDLSSFNTAKMTHMTSMFNGCSSLTTIYAGDGWTTASVTNGEDMFTGCTNLVGGNGTPFNDSHTDHTYARIDEDGNPGYFTYKASAPSEPYAVLSEGNTVLTFYYDNKKEANGGMSVGPFSSYDYRGWHDQRESIKTVVFESSFAGCTTLTSTYEWFYGCSNLTSITGIDNLKTDNVENMGDMFYECKGLTSLDVSGFKTDNVTDMRRMFYRCTDLTSITGIENFKTDNVTDMGGMFYGCSSLTSLDVSTFNTTNVTNMGSMFFGCNSLTSLDVSTFNTMNVTNMSSMFWLCSSLTSLDVSGFKTENVTKMGGMFTGCSSLTSLDVSGFKTDNVTDMVGMFMDCSSLTSLDVSGFKTDYVTDLRYMFYECKGLTFLDVSGFKTDNVTNIGWMFYGCSGLTTLDVSGFKTDNVTDMDYMFYRCSSLASLDLGSFNTAKVTNMEFMFCSCSGLTSLDVSGFKTENVTDLKAMFQGCSGLTSLDVSGFKTDKVTSMCGMFAYCSGLTSLDLSKFKTDNVTDMSWMFRDCSGLKSLDLSGFKTDNVTDMGNMFFGCSSLTTIYAGSGWTTANVDPSTDMFDGCTNLVGGNGTPYSPNHRYAEYARIDTPSTPGYFTDINALQPYAVLSDGNKTLTFFYDNKKEDNGGMSVGPFDSIDERGWNDYRSTITSVVFDPSFANCTSITSMAYWFDGCSNLASITNIENLKTDNVTDMHEMFVNCSSLTSLSLSGFKTDNVTNMNLMFHGCSALTNLDASGFKTDNVTGMNYMFYGCYGLTSLNVSGFKTENVTDMAGMFRNCSGLTSLDISGFKTDNVKGMSYMFNGCSSLTTIYAGSGWTTANVISSEDMFSGCTNLVGGNGTPYSDSYTDAEYARIDTPSTPGYFTDKSVLQPYAVLSEGNTVLTFYYDKKKEANGGMSVGPFDDYDARGWSDYVLSIKSVVFDASFADCTSLTSTAYWFSGCSNLTAITGIENLKTDNVTDMVCMFMNCYSLTSLDVKGFKTENVSNMQGMFDGCSSLKSLEVSGFKTDNVTDMLGMFAGCHSLTSLDVSGFMTENVTSMFGMFDECQNLTSLDVTGFKTDNVTNMSYMFHGCPGLTSLDVTGFNTENVTDMAFMFCACYGLTSLDVSSFNTAKVTNMEYMFNSCSGLTTIYAGDGWSTASVTNGENMFTGCTNLVGGNGTPYNDGHTDYAYARIDMPNTPGYFTYKAPATYEPYAVLINDGTVLKFFYDDKKEDWGAGMSVGPFSTSDSRPWYPHAANITSVVFDPSFAGCTTLTSTAYWFYGLSNLTSITGIEYLKTDNVTNMHVMFNGCSGLTSLDLSGFKTDNVTSMLYMFAYCSNLTSLNLSGFKTDNVTRMDGMFNGCSNLMSLGVSNFNTEKVVNMSQMFGACSSLTNLGVGNFNTENVEDMAGMFWNCSSLTSLDVTNFNTSKVMYMTGMFEGCSGLTSLDVTNFDTENVQAMSGMFYKCSSLTSLDLSKFNTANISNMEYMFNSCSALTTIYAGDGWSTASVTSGSGMFTGCNNLVGGNGTPFNDGHTDYTYARIDEEGNPGYFTYKAPAPPEPYAVLINDGTVLKFFYDDKKEDWGGGMSVGPFSTSDSRPWYPHAANITSVVFDSSFAGCTTLTSTAFWFYGFSNLTSITGIEYLKTDNVKNMMEMFHGCSSLTTLDVSNFNTENVERLDALFQDCAALTSLNLIHFNTAKVTSMRDMFHGCSSLTGLDLSSFNTSNVTVMFQLFSDCSSLTSLDISNFNTAKVTSMSNLFNGCSSLTSLDVHHFVTSEVMNMQSMFYGCSGLTSLDVTNFDTSKVTEMRSMFNGCSGLTTLDLTNFNTSEVLYMNFMFEGCLGLTSLDLSSFNTAKVVYMNSMFEGCSSLATVYVSDLWTTASVTSGDYMFSGCTNLVGGNGTPYDVSHRDYTYAHIDEEGKPGYLTDINASATPEPYTVLSEGNTVLTFYYDNHKTFDSYSIDTWLNYVEEDSDIRNLRRHLQKVVFAPSFANYQTLNSTSYLFFDCMSLTEIQGMENLHTDNVVSMQHMFNGCSSLEHVDLSHLNTANVQYMIGMFQDCKALKQLDLSGFNTSNIREDAYGMAQMFFGCSSLQELDLSHFSTANVTDLRFFVADCSSLRHLDISSFNTDNVTNMSSMFSGCSSLASIMLGNAKISGSVLDDIGNPNLLVYVNSSEAVPSGIQNVVVNNEAEEIVLTFTWEGNGNFYCPKQFMAHKISYTHEFSMETVIGVSRGWETIALPFTVQSITHEVNGPLAPFGAEGGKPFWLGQMTPQGLVAAQQIVANVPYVISMPNNALYPDSYNQNGSVTFSATNCVVPMTEQHAMSSDKCTMVPTFQRVDQSPDVYAINLYDAYDSHPEGSIFVANLREVRPFEAYTLHSSGSRQFFSIDELVADPTGIQEIVFMKNDGNEKVYNLKGQRLATPQKGLNIMNGRKVVIK